MAAEEHGAETQDCLVGTPYRALRELGRGAMGVVFEAEHRRLGQTVCVKLLLTEFSNRPDLVDRLRIEAQSLARLRDGEGHPNLVRVSDFGETPKNQPYLVMERLRGRTLDEERKARKFLPVGEAVDLCCQVLAGLAAAHDEGVIHRDIKPGNIFVCDAKPGQDRVVKVLDFGIAKLAPSAIADKPLAPLAFPTREGVAIGTPRFMAPEAALGRPVDPRADLYGVGLVLYQLIAGRGPFEHRKGIVELAQAHVSEIPKPPSAYATQPIPKSLDDALLRVLAKDPDARFPDARAFADGLRSAIRHRPPAQWASTELIRPASRPGETPADLSTRSEVAARPRQATALMPTVPMTEAGDLRSPSVEGAPAVAAREGTTGPRSLRRMLPFVVVSLVGTILLTAIGLHVLLGFLK